MDQRKPKKPRSPKQQVRNRKRAIARDTQKEKMLIAAAQVFCERGFNAASVDEIAARVGLKKPRLYFHFQHKREILKTCVERALCQWHAAIAEIKERPKREVTLKSIVERYADVAFGDFGFCTIVIGANSLVSSEVASLLGQKVSIDTEFKNLLAIESSGEVRSLSEVELYWLIASSLVHGIALLKNPEANKHTALSQALGAIPVFSGRT